MGCHHPQRLLSYTRVCVLLCVKDVGASVSCPAQCVTTYPDPDPSPRAPSHHRSQSLMVLPPPGLHSRVSFERLRGSFAAGCPPSKNIHETREGGLPVCDVLDGNLVFEII